MSSLDGTSAVPKQEQSEEDEFSDSEQEADGPSNPQEAAPAQKRKGGRKPIYATSEERKQRNRQAQAAFRERRTEYIKQLETTIKHHEETLQSLQQSHRSAADECLMLRYKNSLLERILLEKGINVQAELQMKTEGSNVPLHPAANPQQKAFTNRHNAIRRQHSNPGQPARALPPRLNNIHPPRSHSMTSGTMSPVDAKSPHGMGKGGVIDGKGRTQAAIQPRAPSTAGFKHTIDPRSGGPMQPMPPSTVDGIRDHDTGNPRSQPNFYPPGFQSHFQELEQDYNEQADMLEDDTRSDASGPGSAGPGPYPIQYPQQNIPPGTAIPLGMQGQPPMGMHPMPQMHQPRTSQPVNQRGQVYGVEPYFDTNDPSLDADPFGLTASMHFPTQFTYIEGSARRV